MMNKKLLLSVVTVLLPAVFVSACKEGTVDIQDIVETAGSISRHIGNMGQKSDAEERQIGQDVSATLLGAFPLSRDHRAQNYVNRIGVWLAMQTEREHLQWRFGVLEVQNINAFASPGGYIFVTRGLLDTLENEAQLAGVLSHEIAHVIERHHMKELQSNATLGIASDLGQFAIRQSSDNIKTRYMSEEMSNKLIAATKSLYSKGLAKDDEYAADQLGMLISARAGYDPFAYLEVLHKLDKFSSNDSQLALLFKTHPRPAERLASLEELLQSHRLDSADNKVLIDRFKEHIGR